MLLPATKWLPNIWFLAHMKNRVSQFYECSFGCPAGRPAAAKKKKKKKKRGGGVCVGGGGVGGGERERDGFVLETA